MTRSESTGIYVHVPFCKRHCPYCDFTVAVVPRPPWERFVAALLREMQARRAEIRGPVETVYFGGGTPSLMPAEAWEVLLTAWQPMLRHAAEVTLEVNPEHADLDKMAVWRRLGVTRLSFGTQSLAPAALRTLGRVHSPEDACHAVEMAQHQGFPHLSMDLIFGVPGQTPQDMANDLAWALQIPGLDHLSYYELTYEPRTSFFRRKRLGLITPWEDDAIAEAHEQALERFERGGWERYEVSSFAKPGGRAVHNQRYWHAEHCVALGPGAVSLERHGPTLSTGGERRRNRRGLKGWLAAAEGLEKEGGVWSSWEEEEHLDGDLLSIERVMTALRMAEGCRYEELTEAVALPLRELVETRWTSGGFVLGEVDGFRTRQSGMQVADALALALMEKCGIGEVE